MCSVLAVCPNILQHCSKGMTHHGVMCSSICSPVHLILLLEVLHQLCARTTRGAGSSSVVTCV